MKTFPNVQKRPLRETIIKEGNKVTCPTHKINGVDFVKLKDMRKVMDMIKEDGDRLVISLRTEIARLKELVGQLEHQAVATVSPHE